MYVCHIHLYIYVHRQDLCDKVLLRALVQVRAEMPELTISLFGDCLHDDAQTCVHSKSLEFADGEPAVNIYTAGGCFKPHEDGQRSVWRARGRESERVRERESKRARER